MAKELFHIVNKHQPPYQPLWFSVKEIAADLGISRSKGYALVHTPGFPCTKAGRSIKIPRAGLIEWLSDRVAQNILTEDRDRIMEKLRGWIDEQLPIWQGQSPAQINAQLKDKIKSMLINFINSQTNLSEFLNSCRELGGSRNE